LSVVGFSVSDKMLDFDLQWKDRGKRSDLPSPRDGVLSDDTKGLFSKFFGF
jgi:hypothetical protein